MRILCKENDKYKSRRPKYYIVQSTAKNLIDKLSIRSRLNPELEYYVTEIDETVPDEELLLLFKDKKYRRKCFTQI